MSTHVVVLKSLSPYTPLTPPSDVVSDVLGVDTPDIFLVDVPAGTMTIGSITATGFGEGPFAEVDLASITTLGVFGGVIEAFLFDVLIDNELAGGDVCPPAAAVPPTGSDPPLPPIWPYPTGNIYQREHFGVNLIMVRKDDFVFDFAASLDAAAFDLTGARVEFTAKYNDFDADASAVVHLDNQALGGVTITSASGGLGTVEIPSASTAALPNHRTRLYYNMRVTTAPGKIKTIRRGYLIVLPNTTDPP